MERWNEGTKDWINLRTNPPTSKQHKRHVQTDITQEGRQTKPQAKQKQSEGEAREGEGEGEGERESNEQTNKTKLSK